MNTERRRKLPIHVAASAGHLDVVKVLIQAGSSLDDVDKFGRSPLMWATTGRYVDVVKGLLQAGASVTSQGNWHALHEACKAGFTELVQILIGAGAPVNNPTHCKWMFLKRLIVFKPKFDLKSIIHLIHVIIAYDHRMVYL